jgi:hypothetical protein
LVNIRIKDVPILFCGKLLQLRKLVLVILLHRADPGIDRDLHFFTFFGRPPNLPLAADALAFFFDFRLPRMRIASEISFFLFTVQL